MYENREAILEECGDDIAKAQNTLMALRTNGSWFCFLLMVVIGIDLQRFLLIEARDQQNPDAPDLKSLELLDVFELARIFARGLAGESQEGVAH